MKHIPQFLTGFSVFINGTGLLGTAKQITLPKVEKMRETITAGGFERSLDTGVFKALECELTFSEFNKVIYTSAKGKTPTFVAKGNLKQRGADIAIVATIKGGFDIDDGNFETAKETERKVKVYCDYYKLEVSGKIQIELDAENMIAVIDGTDLMEKLRNNIL